MSKRFYFDEFSEDIFDDEIQQYPSNRTICNILNQQQQQIIDLEAKLKESEEQIWALENQKLHAHNCLNKLKEQLAEKEKEIENEIKAHHYTIQDMELLEKKHNQDKISFCIEQLEKVKEKLEEDRNNAQALLDPVEREDYHELIGVVRGYRNSIYEVQKLIAEIKGE